MHDIFMNLGSQETWRLGWYGSLGLKKECQTRQGYGGTSTDYGVMHGKTLCRSRLGLNELNIFIG